MSPPLLDWNGARLDAALWQGIRYLEIDQKVPGYKAVVTVHLARAVNGIHASSVNVTGGRSIHNLRFDVQIADGPDQFTVRLTDQGDHSDYSIVLRDGGADPLHPFFARAAFTFYIDCETGDCRPSGDLPAAKPGQSPSVDLRSKDYKGFLKILTEWVQVHNSQWADLAPASTERMLIELLCHQGDMLSYDQDRVANEAFIETASQRYSLRQHGVLLGYPVFDGNAATTVLGFDVGNPGFVPEGLQIKPNTTSAEAPLVFYVTERVRVEPQNNSSGLIPAAWPGAVSGSIAAGSTSALLWGQGTRLERGLRIAFSQGAFCQIVTLLSVTDVSLRGWAHSPSDAESTTAHPLTQIVWDSPLRRALFPWGAETFRIHGNLADARHGELHRAWVKPNAPSSVPRQEVIIALERRTSIVAPLQRATGVPIPLLRALQVPEGPVLHAPDADGKPAPLLELVVAGALWEQVPHFHNSQSYDLHYVATAGNDGLLWLEFGDGTNGREVRVDLTTGTTEVEIEIRYRVGAAIAGNCAQDALTSIMPPADGTSARDDVDELGLTTVTNVIPAGGGLPPQTEDTIRQAIPTSLKHGPLQRAVALRDYAEAAREVQGVARAAAKSLDGVFNTVLVLVDPQGQVELSGSLETAVFGQIDHLRMAGREHFVVAPVYVPLRVELALCVEPGFLKFEVRDRVYAELRPGLDSRPGYFHPDRLNFGAPVEVGELQAFVQDIPGVRSVKALAFRRLSDRDIPAVVDRLQFSSTEIGRLDGDDDFPENGVLKVSVVGLDKLNEDDFAIDGPAAGGGI